MKHIQHWWYSTDKMTVWVAHTSILNDRGVVVDAAPIVKRFIGQSVLSLRMWLKKQNNYRQVRLYSLEK